jgi:hypothetical protein
MYQVKKDGEAWCATAKGFINLQESLSGFGSTPFAALESLVNQEYAEEAAHRKSVRFWQCLNCWGIFYRKWEGNCAPCPTCKVGAQYTKEYK